MSDDETKKLAEELTVEDWLSFTGADETHVYVRASAIGAISDNEEDGKGDPRTYLQGHGVNVWVMESTHKVLRDIDNARAHKRRRQDARWADRLGGLVKIARALGFGPPETH